MIEHYQELSKTIIKTLRNDHQQLSKTIKNYDYTLSKIIRTYKLLLNIIKYY